MKRWVMYGRAMKRFSGIPVFARGIRELGHEVRILHKSDHTPGQLAGCDIVVTFGLHGKGEQLIKDYGAAGVPIVVVDYGYFRRVNHVYDWKSAHWQLSINGLNRPPAFKCPGDRWKSLGLEIAPRGGSATGYPLLCVQTPDDRSHLMSEEQLGEWCREQQRIWPDLLLRPHPNAKDKTYGMPLCPHESLADALAGAKFVITGNSNVGHEALLYGVPVLATVPGAAYSELIGYNIPHVADRLEYFQRCAYGQWTWEEMITGGPQRFLVEQQIPAYIAEQNRLGNKSADTYHAHKRIWYEPFPITKERKAHLTVLGYQIVDKQYMPKDMAIKSSAPKWDRVEPFLPYGRFDSPENRATVDRIVSESFGPENVRIDPRGPVEELIEQFTGLPQWRVAKAAV